MPILTDYLDRDFKIKKEDKIKLPLFYNCTLEKLIKSLNDWRIVADEACDVHHERIVYTFYGASKFVSNDTFKSASKGDFTSCLILNSENCVNIYKIYPLDSGAFSGKTEKMRDPLIKWDELKEKLNIGDRLDRINKMVLLCFENLEKYVNGEITIKNQKVISKYPAPKVITPVGDMHKLMLDQNLGDERLYCCEVLFKEELALIPDNVLGVIVSFDYIDDAYLKRKLDNYEVKLEKTLLYPSSLEVKHAIGEEIKKISKKYTKNKYLNGKK